ncbi:T9SS type B sorting domain-containing protein [Flavivirga spongiicola]|uniref:T9SS type B sorting domain-containing protein n=1 Tax=Flavivirga spongiicola TaxID=421621 RepID=A0ABU7XNE8_9FLAO|nr:choice-of-anchor L domain-containing protein [Flavivirga sp. MEBiC05379]MDO5977284.1 choice-of-anchor L domain-containing protein [Flavivirga sp. MEBiC05379]
MIKSYLLILFFLGTIQFTFSQIKVDDKKYTSEQLIKEVLINSPCAKVENITSSTGTATGNNGIGFFTKEDSNFPLSSGIILSSGKAKNARGPNPSSGIPALGDGNTNLDALGFPTWKGDADLERAIGLATNSTYNASVIEFDFIPTANSINFRFLMASEEYAENFPCEFSDSFAFLLRPIGSTSPYKNLAVIPETTIPISVVNIHNAISNVGSSCPAKNARFFDKLNTGANAASSAINFNGQTKVFTASSTVIPNQRYHIKLVIADFEDGDYDTSVFLEAGSFDIGGSLGKNRTIANGNPGCNGTPIILDATLGTGTTYQWLKNNVDIAGETNPTYNVTVDGEYSVKVNLAGTCSSTLGPVKIEFTTPPFISTHPKDMILCEMDKDLKESFDFTENSKLVLGKQDKNKFRVSYHKTQKDADENTNQITLPYVNTTQSEVVFVRIADLTQSCFLTDSFTISVEKQPIANTPIAFEQCDDDTNGKISFDLSTKVSEILDTQNAADFTVTFYGSLAAANTGTPGTEIVAPIINTTNPQEIFARVENKKHPPCFATTAVTLIVNPLPVVKDVVELKQCDDDTDGISLFNLTEANRLISKNYKEETFTYYISKADAQNSLNAIATPTTYKIPVPISSKVFAKVKTNKGCSRITEVNLVVGATQIPASFDLKYELCDNKITDNDDTNGIVSFDFSDATNKIKALFPSGQQISISYYQNLNDALSESKAIGNTSDYRNTSSPYQQKIYVRIDSDAVNACLGLGKHITLEVKPLPKTNIIKDFIKCSNTDTAVFDFQTKTDEIIGLQTEKILVSYHTTLSDAMNDRNPMNAKHQNISNPQMVYIRAQFDTNNNGLKDPGECYSTAMKFNLIVNRNPILSSGNLSNCSNTIQTMYDLTQSKTQITQGENSVQLNFYESEEDHTNNIPIASPNTYTSNVLEKTLIVSGKSTKGCSTKTTLILKTILNLKITKVLDKIEECETDQDGLDIFDLTVRENQLLNGIDQNTVSITYYENEADAIAGNNGNIPSPKKYKNSIAKSQTVYIRVKQKGSKCYQVVPVVLIVNFIAPIDLKEEYILCFDDQNKPKAPYLILPTKLDPDIYNFEWFLGDKPETSNLISGENGSQLVADEVGTYWVRAIVKKSGCDIFKNTVVIGSYIPKSIEIQRTNETFSGNNILEVTVDGKGSYEYMLDDGDFQSSNVFNGVLFGERTITVRDINACGSKTKKIFVIDHPKYFTPNGDGVNDIWNVVGVNLLKDVRISIFDRYGVLIKQIHPSGEGWNGNFNGNPMPSTDYWFRILFTENGLQKLYKSHFTLKR